MTKQLLDGADVGAVIEHVSGTRMPEHMRRELVGEADNCAPVANHAIGALTAQPPTALVEKDRLGVPAPGPTIGGQLSSPTDVEPAFECRRGHPTERNDAFLRPLAHEPHKAVVQVDIADRQPDDLGDPGTGAVERLQQRGISTADGVVASDRLDQAGHLVERERLGQAFRDRWDLDVGRRIVGADLVGDEEPVQATHGNQRAGNR